MIILKDLKSDETLTHHHLAKALFISFRTGLVNLFNRKWLPHKNKSFSDKPLED